MPTNNYDYREYIKGFLNADIEDKTAEVQKYLDVLELFPHSNVNDIYELAHNPRTIKRAFNLSNLMAQIQEVDSIEADSATLDRYRFFVNLLSIVNEDLYEQLLNCVTPEDVVELIQTDDVLVHPEIGRIVGLNSQNEENEEKNQSQGDVGQKQGENEEPSRDSETTKKSIEIFLRVLKNNMSNPEMEKITENFPRFAPLIKRLTKKKSIGWSLQDKKIQLNFNVEVDGEIHTYRVLQIRENTDKWGSCLEVYKDLGESFQSKISEYLNAPDHVFHKISHNEKPRLDDDVINYFDNKTNYNFVYLNFDQSEYDIDVKKLNRELDDFLNFLMEAISEIVD